MSAGLFGALVAAAILLGAIGLLLIAYLLVSRAAVGRLERRISGIPGAPEEFAELAGQRPLLARMASGGKVIEQWLDEGGEGARLIVQAGWRSAQARLLFYAFQAATPVAAVLFILVLWVFSKASALLLVLYAFILLAISLLLPRWLLRRAAHHRQVRIQSEVPLFIHLLVLLFEAGLSTRQAIASLVREGRGVLAELGRECEVALRQLEAGGDTADVLKRLGDGLEVQDLSTVLGVLRQVDRYGGEVREPLLEALKMIEERRGLDLREKVGRLESRMTVAMVGFFFPALLVFVAGPPFLSLIRALGGVVR